jgi:signal transduction histidine kinase
MRAARLPLRVRVTAAAALALIAMMLLAGWLFTRALADQDRDSLRDSGHTCIENMRRLVETGAVGTPLPLARDSTLLVQILNAEGLVAGSSANVMDMSKPFVDLSRFPVVADRVTQWRTSVENAEVMLFGQAIDRDGVQWPVYVAAPLTGMNEAANSLRRQLLSWSPIALGVGTLLLWIVIGRSLRPVDLLRAEVDAIRPGELHRRVTVPPAHDEVGRLATTMNAMLDRVERSSERQARFVSDASHELRSPLASLRTRLEVALRKPDQADWPGVARSALDQGARMERLVTDLLTLARDGEGAERRAPSIRNELDLGDVVLHAADDVRSAGVRAGVTIDVSGVSGARVNGDASQLERAVVNLVDNAVRHARSAVAVRTFAAAEGAVIEVEDDGDGIASADRERVFERFVRLDEARARRDGGSGLGLSIVGEIVARHGGTVSIVESGGRLGGALLRVVLPES